VRKVARWRGMMVSGAPQPLCIRAGDGPLVMVLQPGRRWIVNEIWISRLMMGRESYFEPALGFIESARRDDAVVHLFVRAELEGGTILHIATW